MKRLSHLIEEDVSQNLGSSRIFGGARQHKSKTKKHIPLLWHCMLGTICAMDPQTLIPKYFDYDYDAAKSYARLNQCTDLRVVKFQKKFDSFQELGDFTPRDGQKVLYGIINV